MLKETYNNAKKHLKNDGRFTLITKFEEIETVKIEDAMVIVKCNKCSNEFCKRFRTISDKRKSQYCSICNKEEKSVLGKKIFLQNIKKNRPNIKVLGAYVNMTTNIEIQFDCGHITKKTPHDILRKPYKGCLVCYKKSRMKSQSEFIKEIAEIRPDIEILGKYTGSRNKIKILHNCGYICNISPEQIKLLPKNQCPYCKKISKRKIEHSKFIKEMSIIQPNIKILGKYVNSGSQIKVQYSCGCIAFPITRNLKSFKNSECPSCSNYAKKTTDTFVKEMKIINPEIEILGEYINRRTPILVKHKCGHIWMAQIQALKKGVSCLKCYGHPRKKHSEFVREIEQINPDIIILGTYVNSRTKIKIKHKSCKNIFEVNPDSLRAGSSCPRCNESKGEKFLSKVLKSNNIPFIPQFNIVKNPETNRWLKSDFSILNKEEPILIIEYDGKQHFKPIGYFGGEDALKATKYRDSIKDEYCKENNIPFVRFNYKQSNNDIEELLLFQLKRMKLI